MNVLVLGAFVLLSLASNRFVRCDEDDERDLAPRYWNVSKFLRLKNDESSCIVYAASRTFVACLLIHTRLFYNIPRDNARFKLAGAFWKSGISLMS
jgi:hypothetical protein